MSNENPAAPLYDGIGRGYATARRPDARIAARIDERLGAGRTELLKLADCGHSPHRDQPKALIDRVVDFVHRRAGSETD